MVERKVSWLGTPFYIFLFSTYPSLALLSTNSQEVASIVVIRPLLASILFTGLATGILYGLLKEQAKAYLGTAVILLLFFSYGHVARWLLERFEPEQGTFIEISLSIVYFAIFCLSFYGIAKAHRDFSAWNAGLNVTAMVLLLFPFFEIFSGLVARFPTAQSSHEQINASQDPIETALRMPSEESGLVEHPDIYYILLDGYSRADTLEAMGYDNSQFLQSLEQMGFYVVACSTSNYRSTLLSMPSIFNMEYLHDFLPFAGEDNSSVPLLSNFLIHNRVRSELEKLGYTIISFETGYEWNEWTDADYFLAPNNYSALRTMFVPYLTQFEYLFLQNTALGPYVENSKFGTTRYNDLYERVNFTLEELPNTVSLKGPKFVYAHILAPHYPFIFLSDGSLNSDPRYYTSEEGTPSDPELTRIGYINNVQFLNSRVSDILQTILQNSTTPPVIIIQGDHGHVIPERRFNNLSAFYLPNVKSELLYPQISSVNTFRVVFNEYFGADFELLEDTSFDAHIGEPLLTKAVKPFPETCP